MKVDHDAPSDKWTKNSKTPITDKFLIPSYLVSDAWVLKLINSHDKLERENADLRELAQKVLNKIPKEMIGKIPVAEKVGHAFQDGGTVEYPSFNAACNALRAVLGEE